MQSEKVAESRGEARCLRLVLSLVFPPFLFVVLIGSMGLISQAGVQGRAVFHTPADLSGDSQLPQQVAPLSCGSLVDQVADHRLKLERSDQEIIGFFHSQVYPKMLELHENYKSLAIGERVTVPKNYFDSLSELATQLYEMNEEIRDRATEFDDFWYYWQEELRQCLIRDGDDPDEVSRDEDLLDDVENYNFGARDNEITAANLLEIFADNLDAWRESWSKFEGKEQVFPEDQFDPVLSYAEKSNEAAQLLRDLSELFLQHLQEIQEQLGQQEELQKPIQGT